MAEEQRPSWFQRFLLPGFAFKGVVIGGGYATGRELAEFFLPHGPAGGLLAILVAMIVWSIICVLTFLLARALRAFDYRSFFRGLLGPLWFLFEIAYLPFLVLLLAVFGAAAGEIGAATFGLPMAMGALAFVAAVAAVTTFGDASVERLFKWMTPFLYGVYVLFAVLALSRFGGEAVAAVGASAPGGGWVLSGVTYGGYNLVGAIAILPMLRHLTSAKDAVVAGALAGPLAIWPAFVFFFCMVAFYPAIGAETLPSEFLLRELDLPLFHVLFQLMILVALLESGVGVVHGLNERIAGAYQARRGKELSPRARLIIGAVVLLCSVFIADRIGLVRLIADGYRALALMLLVLFVAPLLTIGVWRLSARRAPITQQA
ncbi:MAG TPA: hypothetical protein VEA80_01525 [Vitreimonas sp.]|uniref:YkvI family membrane protein n=1 Tax=Vitreimonas sp. TaxID=3069702 RepID=UPI002D359162|nr:hypothetical protein [Vitreimonas sp.]HYD86131.1 hypothetical protein [Vitreimonas sp.]